MVLLLLGSLNLKAYLNYRLSVLSQEEYQTYCLDCTLAILSDYLATEKGQEHATLGIRVMCPRKSSPHAPLSDVPFHASLSSSNLHHCANANFKLGKDQVETTPVERQEDT